MERLVSRRGGSASFFPTPKRLIWTLGKKILATTEAWGGTPAIPGRRYPTMRPRETTPGTYVISGYEPYVTHTWEWSRIAWGTPLRLSTDGEHVLYQTGHLANDWRRVDAIVPDGTVATIRERFHDLFPDPRKYDWDNDGIPDSWVFNDFGPLVVRYFRDPNRNRRRDRDEPLMGEMIHTTPDDEGTTAAGEPVRLQPSHGCIHIKPLDRKRFLDVGAFKAGNLLVVHKTGDIVPDFLER